MRKAIAIATLIVLMGAPARGEALTLLCTFPCSNCNGGQMKLVYKVDLQTRTVDDGQSSHRAAMSERHIKWINRISGYEFQIDRMTGDISSQSGSLRYSGTCEPAKNKF